MVSQVVLVFYHLSSVAIVFKFLDRLLLITLPNEKFDPDSTKLKASADDKSISEINKQKFLDRLETMV